MKEERGAERKNNQATKHKMKLIFNNNFLCVVSKKRSKLLMLEVVERRSEVL